jgi:hypothetical protein
VSWGRNSRTIREVLVLNASASNGQSRVSNLRVMSCQITGQGERFSSVWVCCRRLVLWAAARRTHRSPR